MHKLKGKQAERAKARADEVSRGVGMRVAEKRKLFFSKSASSPIAINASCRSATLLNSLEALNVRADASCLRTSWGITVALRTRHGVVCA